MSAPSGTANGGCRNRGVGAVADRRHFLIGLSALGVVAVTAATSSSRGEQPEVREDFYPAWAATARNLQPLTVVDTDSALGRRNVHSKRITLEDMARMHGHLCDGLVTAWAELSAALRVLFPDCVVDRTDVRAVSKNAPCWSDAGAWMAGARVNQGTLMLDNSVGDGFIVQRISTGRAVRVSLRPGVYPAELTTLEQSIRSRRARGEAVAPAEIDKFEAGANEYSRRLLNTPPEQAVQLVLLSDYSFPDRSQNPLAARSDTIDRDVPRGGAPAQGKAQ